MKFNKKAVRTELDKAASELDSLGYRDLADKVDKANYGLMQAKTNKDVTKIRKYLEAIDREANRRQGIETDKERRVRTSDKTARSRRLMQLKAMRRKRLLDKIRARKEKKNSRSDRIQRILERRKKARKQDKTSDFKDALRERRLMRELKAIRAKRMTED